jgi:glutamate dehydrogenase/leucine dehydrogenase
MEKDSNNLNPQLVVIAEDKSTGLLGYVVVDDTINGHACGGLRMHSKLTIDELKTLARSMTLKYGFTGMAQGGAKAGIVMAQDIQGERKQELIKRFAQIISPLLKSKHYITGPDMNTTQDDIDFMLKSIGMRIPNPRRNTGHKSGFYTALGVMVGIEAAAEYKKMKISNCRVAIEGFGSVGSALAYLLVTRKGSKVIAISTSKGAIYEEKGLDIMKLITLRNKHGDDVVNVYKEATTIDKSELLTLDVDILSPCAIYHTINMNNVNEIKASIICAGANNPATRDAEEKLFKKSILSVPFFMINCGGVLGNKIEVTRVSDLFIEGFIRNKIFNHIIDVIKKADETNNSMLSIAENYSIRNFNEMKSRDNKGIKNIFYQSALEIFNRGLFPKFIVKLFAPVYLKKTMLKGKSLSY